MHDRGNGEFFGVSDGLVQVRYRGPVTVGSPGRAHLRDRDDGISELIWDALAQAGWLGHRSGIQPTIEVCIRVAAALTSRETATPDTAPRPGGSRRGGEPGRIGDDGTAYQRYEGPLHARAARAFGWSKVSAELRTSTIWKTCSTRPPSEPDGYLATLRNRRLPRCPTSTSSSGSLRAAPEARPIQRPPSLVSWARPGSHPHPGNVAPENAPSVR